MCRLCLLGGAHLQTVGLDFGKEFFVSMKQKYTITVADMDLNIISDAAPDEVENIVGILDRKMRDINLKSPRCTKNEAALLCALSYCSERIAMQEAFKKVEKDAFRFAADNEKLKKQIETLEGEIANLRKDAEVMRSILERSTLVPAEAPAKEKPAPKTPAAKVEAEQLSAFDAVEAEEVALPEQPVAPVPSVAEGEANTEDEPAAEASAEEKTAEDDATSKKNNSKANKTRVGNMFDMLIFSDV